MINDVKELNEKDVGKLKKLAERKGRVYGVFVDLEKTGDFRLDRYDCINAVTFYDFAACPLAEEVLKNWQSQGYQITDDQIKIAECTERGEVRLVPFVRE